MNEVKWSVSNPSLVSCIVNALNNSWRRNAAQGGEFEAVAAPGEIPAADALRRIGMMVIYDTGHS